MSGASLFYPAKRPDEMTFFQSKLESHQKNIVESTVRVNCGLFETLKLLLISALLCPKYPKVL